MSQLCSVARSCGACPLIELALPQQRARKLTHLRRLLADAKLRVEPSFHPSTSGLEYRNRIRLAVDETGTLRFFNPRKSTTCAVLTRDLVKLLASVRQLSLTHPDLFRPFKNAELRAPDLDGFGGLLLTPRAPTFSISDGRTWRNRAESSLPPHLLIDFRPQDPCSQLSYGGPDCDPVMQRHAITTQIFTRVPLFGFVQINRAINHALVTRVVEEAQRREAVRAIDLYCGSGNFSLPLAAAGVEVHGIELVRAAVAGAREAARLQKLNARFHHGSAETWGTFAQQLGPHLVICDPPRTGLKKAHHWITSLGPRHIFLCSCNPETLVSDLDEFARAGYHLESIELFDMFSHTDHVEVLAIMERAGTKIRPAAPQLAQEPSPE